MAEDKNKMNNNTAATMSSDEIMLKYDKESSFRRLEGVPAKLVFLICVGWSLFQLYTGLFGTFPSTLQRAPHLAAGMSLVYLLYPAYGRPGRPSRSTTIFSRSSVSAAELTTS